MTSLVETDIAQAAARVASQSHEGTAAEPLTSLSRGITFIYADPETENAYWLTGSGNAVTLVATPLYAGGAINTSEAIDMDFHAYPAGIAQHYIAIAYMLTYKRQDDDAMAHIIRTSTVINAECIESGMAIDRLRVTATEIDLAQPGVEITINVTGNGN